MELPSRPAVLESVAAQIVPSILLLFLGLKPLYASRHVNKPDLLTQAQDLDEDQNGNSLQHVWMNVHTCMCCSGNPPKEIHNLLMLLMILIEI